MALRKRLRLHARVAAPRLQMSVIVGLTALSGLLASIVLLRLGMQHMGLRYGLCVLLAYGVFVALMGCWRHWRNWDLPTDALPTDAGGSGTGWSGQGGQSGGGGASASYDGDGPAQALEATATSARLDASDAGMPDIDLPDVDIDVGDGIWLLPVLLLSGGVLIALFWVVWISPVLLAEVALDAALSAGLYRHLRRQQDGDWLFSTVAHTWKPFLLALICALIIGAVLSYFSPDASTLGQALLQILK